ncbi:unnamed protein product [Durusdinium trenchii]|uniref:Uncharacterized protein n=2 Tax=Durusdinium trenchii TaxID=1381693 RepID=A0ABP0NYY9_9DINO|eukprot:g22717.t1
MTKLQHVDEQLFEMTSSRALDLVPTFKMMEISSIAWTFASSQVFAEPLMSALSRQVARHLQRPERKSARSLAGILWALAKTLWPDEALEEALATEILSHELNPHSLAATVWCMARLTLRHLALQHLGSGAGLAQAVQHFGAQESSNRG